MGTFFGTGWQERIKSVKNIRSLFIGKIIL